MGVMHKYGLITCLIPAMLALAACNQKAETGGDPAKPQAALAVPGSGGRNAAPDAAAGPAAPAQAAAPAAVQGVDFGDDASKFARDGECDDKRFSGEGMTNTPLLESDIGHDATDCRTAYNQKRLTLASAAVPTAADRSYAATGIDHIMWGDDNGKFSRDGECDDKRFAGAGMTATPLLDSDIKHDATDCRAAFNQGRLTLRQ